MGFVKLVGSGNLTLRSVLQVGLILMLEALLVSQSVSSVTQLCLTLCDSMNCSMPGLPVHHQHPESTQTHVHWVGPAISSSVVPFSSCHQSLLALLVVFIKWPIRPSEQVWFQSLLVKFIKMAKRVLYLWEIHLKPRQWPLYTLNYIVRLSGMIQGF